MSSAKSDGPPSEGPGAKPGSKSDTNDDLKTLPVAEVEKRLASSPKGLTQAEATTRLEQYGPNEIEAKKVNQFLKFLSYFWGPIPWMIEVAVILSACLLYTSVASAWVRPFGDDTRRFSTSARGRVFRSSFVRDFDLGFAP